MSELAKSLIVAGVLLILIGGAFALAGKWPPAGKLPGDIVIRRHNFTFYFPLGTSILLSVLLSIILMLISRR